MKLHTSNPFPECPLYSEFVSDFAALERLSFPSPYTVLLIAADTRSVPVATIVRVVEHFLASGLISVCCWGPDCERVHDIFDEVDVGDGVVERPLPLMTTWHDNETLEDVIWYLLYCAVPMETEVDVTAISCIAVTVGNSNWAISVEEAFSDVEAFSGRILSEKPDETGNG